MSMTSMSTTLPTGAGGVLFRRTLEAASVRDEASAKLRRDDNEAHDEAATRRR
jgi:hypothetical protein